MAANGTNDEAKVKTFLTGAVVGGALSIGLYKLVLESENRLIRRLRRRNRERAELWLELERKALREKHNRPVRIWVDGCFDLMHFGHANAFRQARALGDHLIVGINPDAEVVKHKGGPPIMNDHERYVSVESCRWVDEVVTEVPYVLNEQYLHEVVFGKYKVDYVVHGDDPCLLADGTDVFASSKRAGKFKTIKRTEGVSTTDIVGRMLLMTREHHQPTVGPSLIASEVEGEEHPDEENPPQPANTPAGVFLRPSNFLPTSRRISQFSPGKQPKEGDTIVYVRGAFDMFHAGHIERLKAARQFGNFLLVGVLPDDVVNRHYGLNYPILNLNERVLGVLSCKYVDEVIIGTSWTVTRDQIVTMKINAVVSGDKADEAPGAEDPYAAAKAMGIYKELLDSNGQPLAWGLQTSDIVRRVVENRAQFEGKFEKKNKAEQQYNEQKQFVQEM
eukprot:TRINITY_DN2843_c0_g1_i1.p1 TRINITY_DN2843_c0_g1~~TRINITY_DN2843_c0_g1_i1.p1  ORF type:complete len:447 (-),score=111.96 TRINITY_DN2843_c0_g1_i1:277-1617(-)